MKYIATDRNGNMTAFEDMPINVKGVWVATTDCCQEYEGPRGASRNMGVDSRHRTGTLRLTYEGNDLTLTTMFGVVFHAPEWAAWAVVDAYGSLFVFEHQPRKKWWGVMEGNGQSALIGHINKGTFNIPVQLKRAA